MEGTDPLFPTRVPTIGRHIPCRHQRPRDAMERSARNIAPGGSRPCRDRNRFSRPCADGVAARLEALRRWSRLWFAEIGAAGEFECAGPCAGTTAAPALLTRGA